MSTELEIGGEYNKESDEIRKSQIMLDDKAIDDLAKKMAEKTGISIDKAKTELGIGIMLGIMMNRHRIQEINDKD